MKLITQCPACKGRLQIRTLQCPDCGMELKNNFELSPFDALDEKETEFLICFLKCQGNLSQLQEELKLSYPAAKKRLSSLLNSLKLLPKKTDDDQKEKIDMENWITDPISTRASEIVKTKLKAAGGHAAVRSVKGNQYEVFAEADGKSFSCSALPIKPNYTYEVFDVVVDLLVSQGGKARKGLGRKAKLGEPECEETTVVGAIGKVYSGHKIGDWVFDPVFILSAILEWAGIVHNERGYLELTAEYAARL